MYRNYSHLKPLPTVPTEFVSPPEQPDIIRAIFEPDPVTGWPMGSIAQYKNDNSPEVRDYIERQLLQPISTPSSPAPDADTALEAMRKPGESIEDYFDRLQKMARNEKDEEDD